ncbi:MAG: PQQ-binding-like beta-propeller repeat protein [Planctomycetes bacterium]|nr:PQQ-binding-like beta-propeller repeat protein [Planctomycetota bacterium]
MHPFFRQPGRIRRGFAFFAAAGALVLIGFGVAVGDPPAPAPRTEREGLVPPSDRDAESWLKRARDAAAQQDWKLAADTLMRVVEQFGDKTVSPDDGQQFISALRCAQEQIASWPAEGLQTYRLLYDADVRGQLAAAQSAGDLPALRRIASRFPHTTPGPEAINLLAARLIDAQEFGEAVDLLNQLLGLSHATIPVWQTLQKLVVAAAMSGDSTTAQQTLEQLKSTAPADQAGRVAMIESFLSKTKDTTAAATSAARQLTAVEPALTADASQRDSLLGAQRVNLPNVLRLTKKTGRPVVWQMAFDGRHLFTTCPEGLVAHDLEAFERLWRAVPKRPTRDPRVEAQRQMMGTYNVDNTDRLDEFTTRSLFHEYRGALSTALGLVFMIEQIGTSNEQFPTKEGVPPPNNIFVGDEFAEPNSLRAYEAESGKAVWTKGRGGPVEDGLRHAHFLAPPIAVNDLLVTPVQIGADLYLAALQRDGKIAKLVLLGSGQPGMFPMNGVLPPTVHQGTLFVPTGAGMLIAISTHDFSLRWQTAYKRAPLTVSQRAAPRQWGPFGPATGGLAQPDEWLSSAPLASGGLVLLAPTDGESLLAFNRQTGKQVWSFPRGSHRYLVGADARRAFVAGKTLLALDIANGQSAWSFSASPLVGRPALCGETLFVPTDAGLIRLKADTGERVGEAVALDEPFGNLFVYDGALYSVNAEGIAKFPDVERSRRMAESVLEQNPNDRKALLRLAGLAATKKEWGTVLDLLEKAESEKAVEKPSDPEAVELSDRIRRQRVTALVNLASTSDDSVRMSFLDRAAAVAMSKDDQAQVQLAKFDYLREKKDWPGAFVAGLKSAREYGDLSVSVEPELDTTVSARIAPQLDAMYGKLDMADLKNVLQSLEPLRWPTNAPLELSKLNLETIESVRCASDAVGANSLGFDFDDLIARRSFADGDYESGVYYLSRSVERAVRCSASRDGISALKLRLAIALAYPGPGLPVVEPGRARSLIEELQRDAASLKLPKELPPLPMKAAPTSVSELLNGLLRSLESVGHAPSVLSNATSLDVVALESAASLGRPDVGSFWDARHPLDSRAGVVPLRILKQVKGLSATASVGTRSLWSNVINLPLDDEPNPDGDDIRLTAQAAAYAGPVAVLDLGMQACAVGLSTGRMLWPPVPLDRANGALPEPPLISVGPTVILATDCATLVAVPARQGAAPQWRRRFPGKRLVALAEAEGYVVAIETEPPGVCVLDAQTGRVHNQFSIESKSRRTPTMAAADSDENANRPFAIPFSINRRVISYGSASGLVGRDLLTGRTLWNRPAPAGVLDVRRLDDEHLAVTYPGSEIEVFRAENGESLRRLTLDALTLPPIEMSLDRVKGATEGSASSLRLLLFTKTIGEKANFVIRSIPLAAGATPWQRELGPYASINRQMISASPEWVTVVQYGTDDRENRPGQRDRPQLGPPKILVLDKAGGRSLIENPPVLEGRLDGRDGSRSQLVKDVIVLDQRIIAVSPYGYYVLARSDSAMKRPAAASDRLGLPEDQDTP